MQFVPETCQTQLVSLNLLSVREPTYHIARFLPSIKDSKAPFIFAWQVSKCISFFLGILEVASHSQIDASLLALFLSHRGGGGICEAVHLGLQTGLAQKSASVLGTSHGSRQKPERAMVQIMVPGRKEHVSMTVAWALDHDPMDPIKHAMQKHNAEATPEAAPEDPKRAFRVSS